MIFSQQQSAWPKTRAFFYRNLICSHVIGEVFWLTVAEYDVDTLHRIATDLGTCVRKKRITDNDYIIWRLT